MKSLPAFLLLFAFLSTLNAFGQDDKKNDKKEKEAAQGEMVKSYVDSKNFSFQAEQASPLKGNIVTLTRGYAVKVMPDKVTCDLPYFGEAHQATIDQTNTGFQFTSSSFDYTSKARKKGGWDIAIKPQDVRYGPQLYFTIQANGAANLRISSNDRQSISYTGVIEGNK